MAEILLCKHPCSLDSVHDIHDMYSMQLKHKPHTGPPILRPYRPYLYSTQPSFLDENVLATLDIHLPKKDITDMAFDLGEENTIAIAEIAAGLSSYGSASAGAAATVYSKRMQSFGLAVERYQNALLEYRSAVKSDSVTAAAAKQKAIEAYQKMQRGFQREINVVKSKIRRGRSLTLTRPRRALDVARNSRRLAKLHVSDEVHASRLVRFGRYGRYLGNGLAVIDFGSRVSHIHDAYEADGDWCREMFVESSSFATSAIAGTLVANAGTTIAEAALASFVAATPAGWVLIVIGIGVAATAAGISIYSDKMIKENSGNWYDSIMKWLNIK